MRKEFELVRQMGSATAEEWLKGLAGRGKELRSDSSRWESWATSGGLIQLLAPDVPATSKQGRNRDNQFPQMATGK